MNVEQRAKLIIDSFDDMGTSTFLLECLRRDWAERGTSRDDIAAAMEMATTKLGRQAQARLDHAKALGVDIINRLE